MCSIPVSMATKHPKMHLLKVMRRTRAYSRNVAKISLLLSEVVKKKNFYQFMSTGATVHMEI